MKRDLLILALLYYELWLKQKYLSTRIMTCHSCETIYAQYVAQYAHKRENNGAQTWHDCFTNVESVIFKG